MPDDTDTDFGFPYIPLSRLRELKHHAEMVVIATADGSFKGSDLWRVYVGLEVNAQLANHWYNELDKARSYEAALGEKCPLCLYEETHVAVNCGYHKQIYRLVEELEKSRNRVQETQATIDRFKGQRSSE